MRGSGRFTKSLVAVAAALLAQALLSASPATAQTFTPQPLLGSNLFVPTPTRISGSTQWRRPISMPMATSTWQ